MRIVEVSGPPCSGKSTYVCERFTRGQDMIIDWDRLAAALGAPGVSVGSGEAHDSPPWMKQFQQAARDALYRAVARASRQPVPGVVWVITCEPAPLVPHERVVMDAPMGVCLERAAAAGRDPGVAVAIRKWFAARGESTLMTW